jgi:hypothetical protein
MRRNIWLSFSEWQLICEDLSDQERHAFQLSNHELKEFKRIHTQYNQPKCFARVGIYPTIDQVKISKSFNILCRENWRPQDMYSVMNNIYDFVGFILNHCEDVSMDTSLEKWEEIRTMMKNAIVDSEKQIWWDSDLVNLYKKQTNS